jgi:hypothetical protein
LRLKRSAWLALPYAAGMTGFLLLLALLNPFGLALDAETGSKALWQKLSAPYYGISYNGDSGREAITVVLVDDRARAQMSLAGPFNAQAIAQMIEDVVAVPGNGRPAAVFVDLLLGDLTPAGVDVDALVPQASEAAVVDACNGIQAGDPTKPIVVESAFRCLLIRVAALTEWKEWRDDESCRKDPVAKLRCIRGAGGIPIIFADPGRVIDPVTGTEIVSRGQAALDRIALTASVRVDFEKGYPLVSETMVDGFPEKLSAAALLYVDYCARAFCDPAPVRRAASTGTRRVIGWQPDYRRKLDVIWGEGVRSDFTNRMALRRGVPAAPCVADATGVCVAAYECAVSPPGLAQQGWAFAKGLFSGVKIDPTVSAIDTRCLHTHWLSFSLFDFLSADERVLAFDQRMVLIGGSLANDNDVVAAGPLGGLPGVFYHAMALDNLVQRGPNYAKVATPIWPWFDMTGTDLANIALVFVTTLVSAMVMHWLAEQVPAPRSLSFWARRVMLLAAIGGGLLAMLFVIAWLGPIIPNGFNIAALLVTGLACGKDIFMRMIEPAVEMAKSRWVWLHYLSLDRIGNFTKSTAAGDS